MIGRVQDFLRRKKAEVPYYIAKDLSGGGQLPSKLKLECSWSRQTLSLHNSCAMCLVSLTECVSNLGIVGHEAQGAS